LADLLGKATILPIQSSDIEMYWPFVSECISRALEQTYGETSLKSIRDDLEATERQLFVIKDGDSYIAAVVTMVYTTQSGIKIGEITIAGGSDHAKWDHFTDVVGEWFKAQGCDYQDIIGRAGWHRLYKHRGFDLAYQQLRKKL